MDLSHFPVMKGPARRGPGLPEPEVFVWETERVSLKEDVKPKMSFFSRFRKVPKTVESSEADATLLVTDSYNYVRRPEAMSKPIGRQLLDATYEGEKLVLAFDGFTVFLSGVTKVEVISE